MYIFFFKEEKVKGKQTSGIILKSICKVNKKINIINRDSDKSESLQNYDEVQDISTANDQIKNRNCNKSADLQSVDAAGDKCKNRNPLQNRDLGNDNEIAGPSTANDKHSSQDTGIVILECNY